MQICFIKYTFKLSSKILSSNFKFRCFDQKYSIEQFFQMVVSITNHIHIINDYVHHALKILIKNMSCISFVYVLNFSMNFAKKSYRKYATDRRMLHNESVVQYDRCFVKSARRLPSLQSLFFK